MGKGWMGEWMDMSVKKRQFLKQNAHTFQRFYFWEYAEKNEKLLMKPCSMTESSVMARGWERRKDSPRREWVGRREAVRAAGVWLGLREQNDPETLRRGRTLKTWC